MGVTRVGEGTNDRKRLQGGDNVREEAFREEGTEK